MSRPLSRLAVVLAAALVALAASVTGASLASAHVTAASADAAPGGYGKVVFRVPNESDTASTVGLRIQVPAEAALASLRVQPVPGWTATLTSSELPEPLEAHGQEITSYVSVVEFRATGPGIAPGEFQEFALSGGPFPDADELTYPTVQSYSDGTESAWIEPAVDGEEPERPAPVLSLAADSGADGAGGDESSTESAAESGSDDGTATAALVVAVIALVGAVAAVVLGLRAGRRTVAP
ncbi:YcnI family protein [Blastococcus sp. TML/M2B]|uniref:YcnI family protein n=1 Tax=unclassified Blastococcus TaxID=2619396 RepID=UPI00190E5661|nr:MULTISPECIES: YcnI family protein [unclassified Blastococcus]MBN1091810.1 YcnI family protein [Blastococcus sp. TML/M2B]MBN1094630.1 YcnI family protein [Blastococcus sp. TML/C7B]